MHLENLKQWETTHFHLYFFKMVEGSLGKILFASWYCGFQTFQKTSVFFGSCFCNTLKTRTSPSGRWARSRADNLFWMIFFMWSGYYAWFYMKKDWSALNDGGVTKNVRIVNQNAPLTNQMKLSGKGAGEIQYRAVFLEASRLLNSSCLASTIISL